MPFKEALEEFVNTLPPEIQGTVRELGEKNQALAEGWLRQADYDKYLNEKKEVLAKADEWIAWAGRNKPLFDQKMKEYTDLEKKYNEVLASKGGDMTPEQIAETVVAEMKKAGVDPAKLSDAQIAASIEGVVKSQIDTQGKELEQKFLKETLPSSLEFMAQMIEKGVEYKAEFGKPLDRQAFTKFIAQNPDFKSVNDAYDKFIASDKKEKDHQAEIEKVRQEERTKLANQTIPGSGVVSDSVVGPVVDFIKPKAAEGAAPTGPVSSQQSIAAAAAELRSLGKV